MAGLYYFDEHANHAEFGTIDIPKEFIPGIPIYSEVTNRYVTADAKSKAAYFQATYQITEPLSLTLGGRYTKDTRDATRTYTSNALAFVAPPAFPAARLSPAHRSSARSTRRIRSPRPTA